MSVSNRELCDATAEALRTTADEVNALTSLQQGISRDLTRVDVELLAALELVGQTLLPSLDDAHLDRAAKLLRQPQLSSAQARTRRAKETQEIERNLQRLHADPLWLRRHEIENEVAIERAELTETIAPLQASVSALEAEPLWQELYASGYGTDAYAVPWWSAAYYRHWKHGDLIVERHGPRLKVDDFKGIVTKYSEERQALGELQTNLARIDERAGLVKKVVAEVERNQQLLRTVDERALTRARAAVRDFLQPLEDGDLLRLLEREPDLLLCAKRVCGVRAKQKYLQQLLDEGVAPSLNDVSTLRAKLERDLAKLRRPKNARRSWSNDDLARRRLGARPEKWEKRREQWSTTRTRVVCFQHYERWDPVADLLWWDLMTDGELDGDFVPEVRARGAHHHHHHHSDHDVGMRDIS